MENVLNAEFTKWILSMEKKYFKHNYISFNNKVKPGSESDHFDELDFVRWIDSIDDRNIRDKQVQADLDSIVQTVDLKMDPKKNQSKDTSLESTSTPPLVTLVQHSSLNHVPHFNVHSVQNRAKVDSLQCIPSSNRFGQSPKKRVHQLNSPLGKSNRTKNHPKNKLKNSKARFNKPDLFNYSY